MESIAPRMATAPHAGSPGAGSPLPGRGDEQTLPEDRMVESLRAENRQLRREMAKLRTQLSEASHPPDTGGRLEFDLEKNLLKLRNIKTQDTLIERMDLRIRDGDDVIRDMLSMDSLLAAGGALDSSALATLRTAPMEITDVAMRIPHEAATRAIEAVSSASLRKEGIKDLEVSFGDGNRLTVKGSAKKLITVPFTVSGELSVTPEGSVKYAVDDMTVAGILPVPRLLSSLMMSLSGDSFAAQGVRREENAFFIDASRFIPKNIHVALRSVRCEEGFLVLQGGAPPRQPGNPVTMSMA